VLFRSGATRKCQPIPVRDIEEGLPTVPAGCAEVLKGFRAYQAAVQEWKWKDQMALFVQPPISERHFTNWGMNRAMRKNKKLHSMIASGKNIEIRSRHGSNVIAVELMGFPLVWIWTKDATGTWKIAKIIELKSYDHHPDDLPGFYFVSELGIPIN